MQSVASGLEAEILDDLERMEGGRFEGLNHIAFRDPQLHVSAKGRGALLVDAMKAENMEHMVTEQVHSGTLKAWVKEMIEAAEPLPTTIAEIVTIETRHRLGLMRRAL